MERMVFIFESVAAMANLEPAMEGAFSANPEKPFAELTLAMKVSAKQLCCVQVNKVREKSVDPRQKRRRASQHRGMDKYQD